jgi:hypothetical protein
MWIILAFVFCWLIVCFVVPYKVFPHVRRKPLPSRIPKDLEDTIHQLERQTSTPYEFVREVIAYVLSQQKPSRISALRSLKFLLVSDAKHLLRRRGFLFSYQLSYLARLLIARSEYFSDSDIRFRYTILNFRLHHYLQVFIAGQWYDVDAVGVSYGVRLGRHAWFFS